MKHIYFVRHGESKANTDINFKGENSLTEKGIAQARALADRFKNIEIDALIHTSKIRSQQTAEAIEKIKNVPVIENDLFLERRGDFELIWEFKHLSQPEITEAMRQKLEMPNWEYTTQEQFEHLKDRAERALAFLETIEYEKVAVVTHGAFLKFLILYMLLRNVISEEQMVKMMNGMAIQNTAITYCRFYTEPVKKWKLISWNDQAHLG